MNRLTLLTARFRNAGRPDRHNFPTGVTEALEFHRGETLEWIIENNANLIATP